VANIENKIERLAYFGWVWEPRQAGEVSTATKDDIAGIDFSLWDIGGESPKMETARQTIRKFLFSCWMRRFYLEAIKWLHTHGEGEYEVNRAAIYEAPTRAFHSSWWEWLDGSRLLFLRWPSIWREEARDGAKAFHKYFPPPCLKARSPPIKEQWIRDLDMVKLEALIKKPYLEPGKGRTKITIPRHLVPKGPTDIRVVWNCTGNGVNPSIYTPSFHLATGATLFRRRNWY
jgi:hypothetical protein